MSKSTAAVLLLAAALLSGCGGSSTSRQAQIDAPTPMPDAGDVRQGAISFSLNCAVCHGATGVEGGAVAPSLRNERNRMNRDELISWIRDPAPPMPALYPRFLSARQVRNIAAYVGSL